MQVRWVTAFIDRPAAGFDDTRRFWQTVTGTSMSPSRGEFAEFATFVPTDGDACLRIQRVQDGPGGSHLDLHVDDIRAAADEAIAHGAEQIAELDGVVVLRSPGGLVFCCVAHHGESTVPKPVGTDGERSVVDQVSIDVAADRYDAEYDFFGAYLGWERNDGWSDEFRALARPTGSPFRLLFQRRDPDDSGLDETCHLDIACDDIAVTERAHVALGATVMARRRWTVMADPSGIEYCLTPRDPDTGLPSGPPPSRCRS